MSGEKSSHDTALELLDKNNGYSDEFIELYNLKTFDQEEINKLYNAIKTKLIDSKLFLPSEVIFHIFAAMLYNIRYSRSYWTIFKKIYEEYHPDKINIIHPIIHYFFYKEYGIIVHQKLKPLFSYFDKMHYTLEVHEENTLYRAIMEDDINAMISFTKKKGFDKNQALCHEYYPESPLSLLELCCYHGSLQCFNYLRSEFKSKITMKCLHLACLGGNKDILTECMHERRPDQKCMIYAINAHNFELALFLKMTSGLKIDLMEGILINSNFPIYALYLDVTNDLDTLFVYSPLFKLASLSEYLLSHGANFNAKSERGTTALHYAAMKNNCTIIKNLISLGANVNVREIEGRSPLHYAACGNSKDAIELLINQGANIEAEDIFKLAPLHISVKEAAKEAAEALLSHGANIEAQDKDGMIPLFHAFKLESKGKEMIDLLIAHGANVNAKLQDGKSLLCYAILNANKEMVETLIKAGADVNTPDNFSVRPLHMASFRDLQEIAKILVDHGADIFAEDDEGHNSIHYAKEGNSNNVLNYFKTCTSTH